MNEELEFLQSLMKKYDKELKTSRNINFKKDFYDVCVYECMPLSKEETFIYRCMTGVIPGFNKKTLSNTLDIKEDTLNRKLTIIRSVLRLYFHDVLSNKRRYNKTVNASNENITIFELGLSEKSLYTLRLLKCYYLKDITTAREDTIMDQLSDKDYLKVILEMKKQGLKFDEKVYRFRESKKNKALVLELK